MCCNCLNRREFLGVSGGVLAAAGLVGLSARAEGPPKSWEAQYWDPKKTFQNPGKPLKVQPILMYATPEPREYSSWKSWGGVQTEQAAEEETRKISAELEALAKKAEFGLEILPVVKAKSPEEAAKLLKPDSDVRVVYPATGGGQLLATCCSGPGQKIVFLRHRSGPVYYWYEGLSVRYLGTSQAASASSEAPILEKVTAQDVVVDDPEELLSKFRGLYGVKNLLGTKIVALGGAWGKYASDAPEVAKNKFGMEIVNIGYEEIEPIIQASLAEPGLMAQAEKWTDEYLALPGTTLSTERKYVVNSFILYGIFKDLMARHETSVFTIKDCMRTIMPMGQTTACMTLGLLNDEGLLAFCESDFVIIPAGILLRHLSGKPVFLHNSTFPHKAMVTCAHCTSPRRLDGDRYEPTLVTTHYESEFGAAPKVDMPVGQRLTFIDPAYTTGRWVGFRGTVESNPFYEICRSQQDVLIEGNWKRLLDEARDSHWVMVYGDYLAEAGYAAHKLGMVWDNITEA